MSCIPSGMSKKDHQSRFFTMLAPGSRRRHIARNLPFSAALRAGWWLLLYICDNFKDNTFLPPGTENFQMVRKVNSKNFMSIYEHKIPNEKMIGYRNEIVDADIVRQGTFVFSQSAWRNQNSCLLIFKIIGIAFDSLYRMLNAIRFWLVSQFL